MYIYLFSMILSHISLQNYFENFPKSRKILLQNLFQAWRSTGLVDRLYSRPGRSTETCVQDVHTCARLSVDRPIDRPKTACSLFFVGRPGRSTASSKLCLPFAASRPSPTAICQKGCRSTGPVDRALWSGRARLCTSVGRPTGRLTESPLLSSFCRSTGPVDRVLCQGRARLRTSIGRPTGRPT